MATVPETVIYFSVSECAPTVHTRLPPSAHNAQP